MKIYIAASSKEIERASWAMREASALGLDVAQDWVQDIANEGATNPTDLLVRRKYAWKDCEAVVASDVFWLLAPEQRTSGAWFEMGYLAGWMMALGALPEWKPSMGTLVGSGLHRRTIIASGNTLQSIFCSLATKEFPTDAEALAWLQQQSKEK